MSTKPQFFITQVNLISRTKNTASKIDVTCTTGTHRKYLVKPKSETVRLEITLQSSGKTKKITNNTIFKHFLMQTIK